MFYEWQKKTGLRQKLFLRALGLRRSRFRAWEERYGKENFHNGKIPGDFRLEQWEKDAIVKCRVEHPTDGYRAITYMMLDADNAAVCSSTTYRVPRSGGFLNGWNTRSSRKGTGFVLPVNPHHHWHIDISYLNICGTFYFFMGITGGCSHAGGKRQKGVILDEVCARQRE